MFDFSIHFKAIDHISKKIERVNGKLAGLGAQARMTKRKIQDSLGRSSVTARIKLSTTAALAKVRALKERIGGLATRSNLTSLALTAATIGGAIAFPLNVFRKYELVMKDIKKAVSGTPEQLNKLKKELKDFKGASFQEIGEAAVEAGKIGIAVENITEFSSGLVKLSKALDIDMGDLANDFGKVIGLTKQMDNPVKAVTELGDAVAHLENSLSGVRANNVVNILGRTASSFANLKFDNTEMAAVSALLDQTHTRPERAAEGFKIVMTALTKKESELGYIKNIKESGDKVEALAEIFKRLGTLTDQEMIGEFGSQAAREIRLYADSIPELKEAHRVAKDSVGAMRREWKLYRATLDAALGDLKKSVLNVMESIGSAVAPGVKVLVKRLTEIMDKINVWADKNKLLIKTIGDLLTRFGLIVGAALTIVAVMAGVAYIFGVLLNPLAWVVIGIGLLLINMNTIIGVTRGVWNSFSDLQKGFIIFFSAMAGSLFIISSLIKGFVFLKAAIIAMGVAAKFAAVKLALTGVIAKLAAVKIAVMTAASWLLNASLWANPLTWIVLAIGVAIVALIYYWDELSTAVKGLWEDMGGFSGIWESLKGFFSSVGQWVADFLGQFESLVYIKDKIVEFASVITNLGSSILDSVGGFSGIFDALKIGFNAIVSPIKIVYDWIDRLLSKFEIYNDLKRSALELGSKIGDGVGAAKDFILSNDDNDKPVEINGVKNSSNIDVTVKAADGTTAEIASRVSRNVQLRTITNGVRG